MDAEYISLPTVRRIDFCTTGCSGEYLDLGVGKGQEICKESVMREYVTNFNRIMKCKLYVKFHSGNLKKRQIGRSRCKGKRISRSIVLWCLD
jgi:hypothetical protein